MDTRGLHGPPRDILPRRPVQDPLRSGRCPHRLRGTRPRHRRRAALRRFPVPRHLAHHLHRALQGLHPPPRRQGRPTGHLPFPGSRLRDQGDRGLVQDEAQAETHEVRPAQVQDYRAGLLRDRQQVFRVYQAARLVPPRLRGHLQQLPQDAGAFQGRREDDRGDQLRPPIPGRPAGFRDDDRGGRALRRIHARHRHRPGRAPGPCQQPLEPPPRQRGRAQGRQQVFRGRAFHAPRRPVLRAVPSLHRS